MHHSHRPGFWTGDYRSVLPYVRNAFGAAVDQIKQHFPADIRDDLVLIIKFLCEPDPVLRGANDYRGSEQYSFERVVSILNRLAHKAEIALKFS